MTDQLFSSKISTLPVNIHVMVVDDDATSLAVVSGLLKALNYEVTSFDDPIRALQTLRAGKQSFDLIVTDLYMTKMDGFELTKRIDKEFMLPVIMISSDDRESVMFKAIKEGVVLYLLKPFTQNDLRNIWQFAISTKSRSTKTNPSPFKEETGSHGAEFPTLEAYSEEAISVSSTNEGRKEKKKKKYTKKGGKGKNQEKRNDKKVKVVWTDFLQYRFLQAVHYIGLERAVPKKILEVMNVPVLTRENVASHLQKYRIFLRKVGEKCMIVSDNDKTTEEMLLSKFMSRHASLLLKKMQRRNEGNIPQSNSNHAIPIPIASSDQNPNSPFSRHPNSFLTNPASGFGSYGIGKTTGLMGSSSIPTQFYQNQDPDFSYPNFPSNNNNNNNFSMGMDGNYVSIMNGISNGGFTFGNDYMGFESMGMGNSDCLGNGRLTSERDEYGIGIGIGSGEDSYKWDSMFDALNFSNNHQPQPQHDHAPMDLDNQNGGQEEEADSDFFASLLPLESFVTNQNTIQQQGSGTFMEEENHQLYNMTEETSPTSPFYIDDQVLDEFLESWLRNDTSAEE